LPSCPARFGWQREELVTDQLSVAWEGSREEKKGRKGRKEVPALYSLPMGSPRLHSWKSWEDQERRACEELDPKTALGDGGRGSREGSA